MSKIDDKTMLDAAIFSDRDFNEMVKYIARIYPDLTLGDIAIEVDAAVNVPISQYGTHQGSQHASQS